ncbi:MAG: hypothetical protein Ct9H90mP23_0710 [Methanobacteriota archaeon]|nr:MAG: hypothetical protein Ct9H90mP23_0710 [Euryarchaeota archaeon]
MNSELTDVVWVPGSMEALSLWKDSLREDFDGAITLGIIERGETQHGLVMGQPVTRAIIDLQIKHDKPIGLNLERTPDPKLPRQLVRKKFG